MSSDEQRMMVNGAAAFEAIAEMLMKERGFDVSLVTMAMGYAATSILYRASGSPEQALKFAEIMAQSGLQSMADMVSGANGHQVMQ